MERSAQTGWESVRPLAEALGVPEDDVLRALGGGWEPFDLRVGEGPATRWAGARWWVTGEPHQVLVGVAGASVVLARPVLRWDGPGQVTTHASDEREFARDDVLYQPELLADTVEEIARRSRRSFRWCRTCRRLSRSEHMHDRLECTECAAGFSRVVH
jgi:hypothetical protein